MRIKRRSFLTMILLSTITCGIYGIYWWWCFTEDMNRICEGRSPEKPSPNYLVVLLLSLISCSIYFDVWMYKQGNRLADAADSYDVRNQTTGTTLLLWFIFGNVLCCLGPFIAIKTWIDLFNRVADAYNQQFPDDTNPGGGPDGYSDGGAAGAGAMAGVGAIAQKMEEGAGNLAGKIQNAKGISDIKKKMGDKIPGFPKGSEQYKALMTSKHRGAAPGSVRTSNTTELWHSQAPVILTKVQIAEQAQGGSANLFLGFQNMVEKNITAIYLDVVCYNMLKEQIGVLTDVCYIDLNVAQGRIFEAPTPVVLPDNSIRKCDIILRHVVYADESIWSYDGEEVFAPVSEQGALNLPDGLNDEFKRQMKKYVPDVNYCYEPEDQGNYWFCACGQLNRADAGQCIVCGMDKAAEFGLLDTAFLAEQREIYLEEEREKREKEEELKAQKAAERNQKIEDAQKKAKNAFKAVKNKGAEYYAKGEEKLKGSGILPAAAAAAGAALVCSKCGKPYAAGDKFCMGCGAKLEPPKPAEVSAPASGTVSGVKICEKCGTENDVDSKFCMGCGNLLESVPVTASPQAAPADIQAQPEPPVIQRPEPQPVPESRPMQNGGAPVEEDQDELRTVVLTPEMAAQMTSGEKADEEAGPVVQNGKIICPACGYENEPGSMFCMGCGSRIDE